MKFFCKSRSSLRVLILGLVACCIISYMAIMGCPNVETINAHQPNIRADFLYQKHKLVLGKDITKLVILIPNEAHHGPHEDKEGRFIEQPFLPASAVVNVGTKVLWFNGDIGYKHTIIINKTGLQGSSLESMTNAFPNHVALIGIDAWRKPDLSHSEKH